MKKIIHALWMMIPQRLVVGGSCGILVTLLVAMTWNDAPTFEEAQILRQGYQMMSYGRGVDAFSALGAALISSAWLTIVSWLGGFSLCFLECPGLSGLSAWQDIQGVLLVARMPFILALVLGILWLGDLVQRHTRSRSSTKLTLLLVCFSPTVLAFGGLIGNWSLSFLGTVILIDLFLAARARNRILDWIVVGLASSILVILVPMLWGVVGLLLVFWVLDWVVIQERSADERYFQAVAGVLYWLVFTGGLAQITYGFFTRGTGSYRWYAEDAWRWGMQLMEAQEVFLFGQWFTRDWGVHTILSYLLKESFPLLILLTVILGMMGIWGIGLRGLSRAWMKVHRFQLVSVWLVGGLLLGAIALPGGTGLSSIWLPIVLSYPLIALGMRSFLPSWNFSRVVLVILGIWYIAIPFRAFPHYISHSNLFTGEGRLAYLTFEGSNIDGGQDLYRLAQWTKSQDIGTIYVDYHGSIDPAVYLGEAYIPYTSTDGQQPDQYIAISVNQYHQAFREKELGLRDQDYWWLEWKHPQAQIGNSIVIYRLPKHK